MQLRFAAGGAAEGWAHVQMSASPFLVSSEAAVLHDMAHHPGTLARYLLVEDGEVLGLTRVRTSARPDEVRAMIQVHPDHRGRGVGTLLLQQMLRVADGRRLAGVVNGDDHSVAVGDHWGFARERSHRAVNDRLGYRPSAVTWSARRGGLDELDQPRAGQRT